MFRATQIARMPAVATKIRPIQGMLKRGIVTDISSAIGLGFAAGYFFWYAYHVPAVRHRDEFYARLEDQRANALGQDPRIPGEDDED